MSNAPGSLELCPFLPRVLLSPLCPLERLGIKNPTVENLKYVACCFAGYHAIRRSSHSMGLSEADLTESQADKTLSIFADFFCHEAHLLDIPHISRTKLAASTGLFWSYSIVQSRPAVQPSGIDANMPSATGARVVMLDRPP